MPQPILRAILEAFLIAHREGAAEITADHLVRALDSPGLDDLPRPAEQPPRRDLPLSEAAETALEEAVGSAGDPALLTLSLLRAAAERQRG